MSPAAIVVFIFAAIGLFAVGMFIVDHADRPAAAYVQCSDGSLEPVTISCPPPRPAVPQDPPVPPTSNPPVPTPTVQAPQAPSNTQSTCNRGGTGQNYRGNPATITVPDGQADKIEYWHQDVEGHGEQLTVLPPGTWVSNASVWVGQTWLFCDMVTAQRYAQEQSAGGDPLLPPSDGFTQQ